MAMEDYKFGIEIECFGSSQRALQTALREAECTGWVVKFDGSVSGNGIEIISPPLQATNESFLQVRKVCRILREKHMRVDRTCGLHVHISKDNGMKVSEVATVLRRYAKFENTIDTWHPRSRRSSNNHYCNSVERYINLLSSNRYSCSSLSPTDLQRAILKNFDQVILTARSARASSDYYISDYNLESQPASPAMGIRLLKLLFDYDRYYKVNLQSLSDHGTIEFRQHAGTLSAPKMLNWVKFLIQFIEKSIEVAAESVHAEESNVADRPLTAAALCRNRQIIGVLQPTLLSMLNSIAAESNAQGMTVTQIKAALRSDGNELSDNSICSYLSTINSVLRRATGNAAGFHISSEIIRRRRHYKLVRVQPSSRAVRTLSLRDLPESDTVFSGISAPVRQFLQNRSRALVRS